MDGRTHRIIGLAGSLTAATVLMPESLKVSSIIVGGITAYVSSTLPDCDQYQNNKVMIIKTMIRLIAASLLGYVFTSGNLWNIENYNWKMLLLLLGMVIVCSWSSHRTITHSIFTGAGIAILYGLITQSQIMTLFFLSGYMLHIAADLLNKKGETLFWPLSSKGYCLYMIRWDSNFSHVLRWLATVWYLIGLVQVVFLIMK